MSDQWYFSHPFTAQSRGDKLRKYLERMTGKTLVNPFENTPDTNPETECHRIVVKDLGLIESCKGVVAWFPRYTGGSPQVGTSMEIFFAKFVKGMPIIIYANPDIAKHPWLNAMGKVFTGIGDVIKELKDHA